jgi:hypothetical protein
MSRAWALLRAPTPPRPSWLLNSVSHLLAASGVYLLRLRKDRS